MIPVFIVAPLIPSVFLLGVYIGVKWQQRAISRMMGELETRLERVRDKLRAREASNG